jgi:hypothetical protein
MSCLRSSAIGCLVTAGLGCGGGQRMAPTAPIPPSICSDWTTQIVDAEGDAGLEPVLALDARGGAHVAYRRRPDRALFYATNGSGRWIKEQIGTATAVDLVVDDSGAAHVIYKADQTDRGYDLRYATNRGGRWTEQGLGSSAAFESRVAIALDAAGVAHITYSDFEATFTSISGGRRYASNASGAWRIETVEPVQSSGGWIAARASGKAQVHFNAFTELRGAVRGDDGAWTVARVGDLPSAEALALDHSGRVHVATTGSRGLAYWGEGGNGPGPVSAATDFDGRAGAVALALDAGGVAHLAYLTTAGRVRYARNPGGQWLIGAEALNDGRQAQGLALRLDDRAQAHLVYYDWNDGQLRYTRRGAGGRPPDSPGPGRWTAENVDVPWSELITGADVVLAFDRQGTLHMVYAFCQGPGCGDIHHAVRGPNGWTSTLIGQGPSGLGRDPALAFEPDGVVHVVYQGAVGLRHATNRGGNWTNVMVAPHSAGSALAVGESGEVHILFTTRMGSNWELRHAVDAGGMLQIETVATGLKAAGPAAVALDAEGALHAFVVSADSALRYAVRRGGQWSVEPFDVACGPQSISVDPAGTHVVCLGADEVLRVTRRGAGDWWVEGREPIRLVTSGIGFRPGPLVVGPGNQLAFGAAVERPEWLAAATNAGGIWAREMIAVRGWRAPSLVFDGAGVLHAGYYDFDARIVAHATRQPPGSSPAPVRCGP